MLTDANPACPPQPRMTAARELVDTLVTVTILVLILKIFLVDGNVIPTGSMGTTLYGYTKDVACRQCRYEYRVNCALEVEYPGMNLEVVSSTCPNCAFVDPVK